MKIVELTKEDMSEEIFLKIKGKPFFCISYDKDTQQFNKYVNNMNPQDVVFSCNAMIKCELDNCKIADD